MASLLQLSTLSFFLVALSILFTSTPVHCDDAAEDDDLLQGLNSYRTARNLSTLVKNDKAECLAEELAGELEHQPCTAAVPATPQLQLANYPSILKKCKIDINYTRDGVIMQVCVPHRVPTLVLTNFTQSHYSRYLNDSKFTGVGVGSEDDWVVAVLSTNGIEGSFSGASRAAMELGLMMLSPCLVALLLGLFVGMVIN
ncbi:putative GPI-anchored protein [Vitis vinifera]|uniref:Putative GPI-anchored protein n=1 Tax=Vitis vinifera TaxID=29760 RepID=A0A438EZV3_VITVI|nr:putative GPI-anchored protein [Vitis vinifera]